MAQGTTTDDSSIQHSTAHASLAALGVHLRRLDLFGPIRDQVHIAQKTVRSTPTDKLYDAFIALLAGAQSLVEINGRLRPDPALQAAFGRSACAEQSVVQATRDACSEESVRQLEAAWTTIYRRHSQGYRHPYPTDWQILDVDMSGMPCGKKAALATTGYFAKQRNRRGRQLGRVMATRYREIVVDRLCDGKTPLNTALLPLVTAAEATLDLDEAKRQRALIRIDAGAGSIGYQWVAYARLLCRDQGRLDGPGAPVGRTGHRLGGRPARWRASSGAGPWPSHRLPCWPVAAHHHPDRGPLPARQRSVGGGRGGLEFARRRRVCAGGSRSQRRHRPAERGAGLRLPL
jgi:hypothetical protein